MCHDLNPPRSEAKKNNNKLYELSQITQKLFVESYQPNEYTLKIIPQTKLSFTGSTSEGGPRLLFYSAMMGIPTLFHKNLFNRQGYPDNIFASWIYTYETEKEFEELADKLIGNIDYSRRLTLDTIKQYISLQFDLHGIDKIDNIFGIE